MLKQGRGGGGEGAKEKLSAFCFVMIDKSLMFRTVGGVLHHVCCCVVVVVYVVSVLSKGDGETTI